MIVVEPTGVIGTAGGLVLAWSSKISMQLINSTENQIDVVVTDKSRNFGWLMSAVYGCPYKIKKHLSWTYFKNLAATVELCANGV